MRTPIGLLLLLGALACDGGSTEVELPHGDGPSVASTDSPGGPPGPVMPPGPKCGPTGGKTQWLEEGETLELTLLCATGWDDTRFQLSPLPSTATLDPVTGKLSWTPGLDEAGVHTLTILETRTGETGTLRIAIADAFDHPDNVPIADPTRYTEEFGVPVMHLDYDGKLSSGSERDATVTYRGHVYSVKAKHRGALSLMFPKRSLTIEFSNTDEFEDYALSISKRDQLVLTTSFNDNSYLRHRLAFELWRRMEPSHLNVKTFSVVVIENGRYRGLYTAMDSVDSDLMKRHGLAKEGELFKAINHDANFSDLRADGRPKASLSEGFEKKEGTDSARAIAELTDFVAHASREEFDSELGQRISTSDYEDWWIFVTLVLGIDSAGKNAYHYLDPVSGVFRYVPWDLDASFGQDWNTARTSSSDHRGFLDRNELFRRMVSDSARGEAIRERYRSLLENELAAPVVLKILDGLAAEIREVALRDERVWQDEYRDFVMWSWRSDFNSHEEEVEYLRQWITRRWEAFQKRLP